jgi:hypothetical protein
LTSTLGTTAGDTRLELNREYLLFAYKYRDELWISNCDDSVPLSEARELIRKIQGIAIPKDAIIDGRIILNYVPSDKGVPGIKVFIRGESRIYRLTTDQQGWFHLHVPPGPYSVEAESTPTQPIVAYDLNYGGDPKKFAVKAGRCAGFEFVASPIYKYWRCGAHAPKYTFAGCRVVHERPAPIQLELSHFSRICRVRYRVLPRPCR